MKSLPVVGLFILSCSIGASPVFAASPGEMFLQGDPAVQLYKHLNGSSVRAENGVKTLLLDAQTDSSIECDRSASECVLLDPQETIDTGEPAYGTKTTIATFTGTQARVLHDNMNGWSSEQEIDFEDPSDCDSQYVDSASYDSSSETLRFENASGFAQLMCEGG